jgi:hypothetical protein
MMIGDRDSLGIELEPVEPGWERRSSTDLGPWARFAIYVRGLCLTQAIEPSTSLARASVYVPLLSLADWFFHNMRAIAFEESPAVFRSDVLLHETLARWNESEPPLDVNEERWEDERYRWYERHFWLAGADGALVPDLAFVRADDQLWLSWSNPVSGGARKLVFTHPPGCQAVPWSVAWHVLKGFVNYVADESRRRGLTSPGWILNLASIEEAAKCSAIEYLSFLAPGTSNFLGRLRLDPAADPEACIALQAMRDLDLSADTDTTLDAIVAVEATANQAPADSHLEDLRAQVRSAVVVAAPERSGYEAARWLRSIWGLNGRAIPTPDLTRILSQIGEVADQRVNGTKNDSIIGAKRGCRAAVTILKHARTGKPWAERMEMARAIGHLLLDPYTRGHVLGAASSQVAAGPRRRRSGSFAAELLCPVSGLRERLAGRDPGAHEVFEEVMEHFGVGARTAAYHLWNHGILSYPEERDALIEEHGYRRVVQEP